MKNLPSIIRNGNLTPREKYILLIQNDVHKAKTGKEILTPADKDALENWKAKDNTEAKEWNRLNDGWKYTGRMEIEAEFAYKDAQVAHMSQLPIILKLFSYPISSKMRGCIKTLKRLKKVTIDEAVKIAGMQKAEKLKEGMDFDYAVYQLAFERLTPEDKERMNELYPDVEADHQYLDQEEIIANLFNGTKELTPEAQEKLASLVAECSYNKFAKEYQLFHYFACIPVIEVARYFLKSYGVEIKSKLLAKNQESDDEDDNICDEVTKAMLEYATEHGTTIEKMLKEGVLKGLSGLFERYTPLIVSNDAELLHRWLSKKAEATTLLCKHVDFGELTLREHDDKETTRQKLYSKGLYDSEHEAAKKMFENINMEVTGKGEIDEKKAFERFDGAVITGDSLYTFKENYEFVKDFKERVDKYDPNLGIVYAENDPEQKGNHLDQELLICGLDGSGEANFFSLYGMSINMLSNLIESDCFFEEEVEDGITYLKFDNAEMERLFRERQTEVVAGYAKLLAYEGILKRIAKIYEVDATYHISERVKMLRSYMEQNNEAIYQATNTGEDKLNKNRVGFFKRKDVLQMKENLIVDVDSIKPDLKSVEDHEQKLKAILDEF